MYSPVSFGKLERAAIGPRGLVWIRFIGVNR
jgi:hypothetical protein